jgi:hypothetical protein
VYSCGVRYNLRPIVLRGEELRGNLPVSDYRYWNRDRGTRVFVLYGSLFPFCEQARKKIAKNGQHFCPEPKVLIKFFVSAGCSGRTSCRSHNDDLHNDQRYTYRKGI